MAESAVSGKGTPEDPWILTTPPGSSEFEAHRDPEADPPALVVQVGSTQLRYQLRCIEDLHALARRAGRLGAARQRRRAEAGQGGHGRGVGRARPTTRSAAGTA